MPLKLAIIGIGKVAREEYLPFLASQPDVSLAYFNRTPDAARKAAEQFGGKALPSLAAVADWKPTAALVLTSETIRRDVGTTLIQAGLPRIFFEKPLVAAAGQAHVTEADFADARDMLLLAKEHKCQTAMVFNYRFFEQTLAARKAVADRGLGEVIHVIGQVHFACWSHCIDLIHFFAGPIEEITALSGNIARPSPELKIDARDVTAAFRLANGATGSLLGTCGMKWRQPLYELIFTFQNGRIHMRDLDGALEILDGSTDAHETRTILRHTSRWDQYRDSFKKAVGAYVQSLRDGSPPPVPGLDGLRELQFEAALKRSALQRRPVRLSEEFPIEGL
ncbi:MAG: Gfo/Idh/MocA family oxidoreductase [Tepidisphaeraceae bacterium]|jgi:predicted dehydrogenase